MRVKSTLEMKLLYDKILSMLKKIKALFWVPRSIYKNRALALSLAKNDFKSRFAGSYLGIVWAFVQPVITVLLYWFVFEIGFKAGQTTGYPFVLYLITGIVPWFFFAESLGGGSSCLIEYSYLVKKVVFNIEILPFVKLFSALYVHIFFIGFTIILLVCYGYYPDIYILQLPYYMLCNFILVLGIVYLFSSIMVFFRDLNQIISIVILQVGMWLTPIMWEARGILGENSLLFKIFKLNPMYYIVDGFRDALLYRQFPGLDKLKWTIYFWLFTLIVFALGEFIFKRLKIHFADVL